MRRLRQPSTYAAAVLTLQCLVMCATEPTQPPAPTAVSDASVEPGAVDGAHEALPDQNEPPDVGPDTPQQVVQVCAPDAWRCVKAVREKCAKDGGGWLSVQACPPGQVCSPAIGCLPEICAPNSVLCIGDSYFSACNADGTAVATSGICKPGTACAFGKGCMPTSCTPGAVSCMADGALGQCDGQKVAATTPPCAGAQCLYCQGKTAYFLCGKGSPAASGGLHACGPDTLCEAGLGCMPLTCSAGESQCSPAGPVAACSASDLWSGQACQAGQLCAPQDDTHAACQIDCAASVACRIAACTPLPPLGTASWGFAKPAGAVSLGVQFQVGLTADPKVAVANIAPIANPVTGEFVPSLTPRTWVGGKWQGNVILREDQVVKVVKCAALSSSLAAQLDLVFLIDVTGSMLTVKDTVTASVTALATKLSQAGLDVRFGAVPFDDSAPTDGTGLPLTDDLTKTAAYFASLKSTPGGDTPENPLAAAEFAAKKLSWRTGAHRVLVLLTDAAMHQGGDGTAVTTLTVADVLALLGNGYVVHTVSSPALGEPLKWADPRILSCATGGTSASLASLQSGQLEVSLFATALKYSFRCLWITTHPTKPHDVKLEVYVPTDGQMLFGSATKFGVSYLP